MKKPIGLLGILIFLLGLSLGAKPLEAQTPVRFSPIFNGLPGPGAVASTGLADAVTFPPNFKAAGGDPDSVVVPCNQVPKESDTYQIQCVGRTSTTTLGTVTIDPTGHGTFSTSSPTLIGHFTTAQPGPNGGPINVPPTVNGHLLIWLVDSSIACLPEPQWNQPTIGNVNKGSLNPFDGMFYCLYDRISANEPPNYSYVAPNAYPAMVMMDVPVMPTSLATALDKVQAATGATSQTTSTIPPLSGLSSPNDLEIGGILSYNYQSRFTPPPSSSMKEVANLAFTPDISAGNWVGQQPLTTNSAPAVSGAYSPAIDGWAAYAIAIAPAAGAGAAVSCGADSRLDVVAPSTQVTGFCPITLAGHVTPLPTPMQFWTHRP